MAEVPVVGAGAATGVRKVVVWDDETIRVRYRDKGGKLVGDWTTEPLRPRDDPDFGTPGWTVRAAVASEWNVDIVVERAAQAEVWRLGPSRIRTRMPLLFARGVPLLGPFKKADALEDGSGFSLVGHGGRPRNVMVSSAAGVTADPVGSDLAPDADRERACLVVPPGAEKIAQTGWDVFVSYKQADSADLAREIVGELRSRQLRVFFDRDSIGSDDYRTVIADAIRTSRSFVVIHSPTSGDEEPEIRTILLSDGTTIADRPINQGTEIGDIVERQAGVGSPYVLPYWTIPRAYQNDDPWGDPGIQVYLRDALAVTVLADMVVREVNQQFSRAAIRRRIAK